MAHSSQSNYKDSNAHQVTLDIHLPGSKRFSRVLNLFGPIDPGKSTFHYFNTKVSAFFGYRPLAQVHTPQVELQLHKSDNRGWVLLEKTTRNLGGITYTFGVGGRTGTVGGKELQLDAANQTRSP